MGRRAASYTSGLEAHTTLGRPHGLPASPGTPVCSSPPGPFPYPEARWNSSFHLRARPPSSFHGELHTCYTLVGASRDVAQGRRGERSSRFVQVPGGRVSAAYRMASVVGALSSFLKCQSRHSRGRSRFRHLSENSASPPMKAALDSVDPATADRAGSARQSVPIIGKGPVQSPRSGVPFRASTPFWSQQALHHGIADRPLRQPRSIHPALEPDAHGSQRLARAQGRSVEGRRRRCDRRSERRGDL